MWLELAPLSLVVATAAGGIVYGLAMGQSRIRSLYRERNAALLEVRRQAVTIDRLLQRQPNPDAVRCWSTKFDL